VATAAILREGRRAAEFEGGGRTRIEADDSTRRIGRRGGEAFCVAADMVLAGLAKQVEVEIGVAQSKVARSRRLSIGASSWTIVVAAR